MLPLPTQTDIPDVAANAGIAPVVAVIVVVSIGLLVIYLVATWKLFTKMGQPGWAGIIPILNIYVVFRLAGRESWWLLLFLIPCLNVIASWVLADDSAKLFGKDTSWSILLFLFGPIGYLILGFGSAAYRGPREQVI